MRVHCFHWASRYGWYDWTKCSQGAVDHVNGKHTAVIPLLDHVREPPPTLIMKCSQEATSNTKTDSYITTELRLSRHRNNYVEEPWNVSHRLPSIDGHDENRHPNVLIERVLQRYCSVKEDFELRSGHQRVLLGSPQLRKSSQYIYFDLYFSFDQVRSITILLIG